MKSTVSKATLGIVFILFGVALAGRALGIFDFNIFFNGWWTLFIIIPCALGLSERGHRTSSMIGLGVGILLLLSAQGALEWYMFGRILIAFIFIVIGCSIMLRGNHDRRNANYSDHRYTNDANDSYNSNPGYQDAGNNGNTYSYDNNSNDYSGSDYGSNSFDDHNYSSNNYNRSNSDNSNNYHNNYNGTNGSTNHGGYNRFTGLLSSRTAQYVDEVFTGAVVTSILGSVQLDLRNAIFNGNASIETTCILGGVDIYVPSNVKVVNNCTSILAGVDNDVVSPLNPLGEFYTLFINGACILGGIEVK